MCVCVCVCVAGGGRDNVAGGGISYVVWAIPCSVLTQPRPNARCIQIYRAVPRVSHGFAGPSARTQLSFLDLYHTNHTIRKRVSSSVTVMVLQGWSRLSRSAAILYARVYSSDSDWCCEDGQGI